MDRWIGDSDRYLDTEMHSFISEGLVYRFGLAIASFSASCFRPLAALPSEPPNPSPGLPAPLPALGM